MPSNQTIPTSSGIYKIVCDVNNHIYVGSATNLYYRQNDHFSSLRRNNHCNIYLQRSYDKWGNENFHFEVLEFCARADLITREQYYIDTLNPEYNIARTAGNTLGVRPTEQAKKKASELRKGIPLSAEHRANLSKANLGRPHRRGFKHTEETKAIFSASRIGNKNCVGYKHTEETKLKMSLAHKGRKYKVNDQSNLGTTNDPD